ncbi:MAG: hypothetical protein U0Z26_01725 [Anaerolineales bacterium]
MPEGTPDASILIATSHQALSRVIQDNKDTIVCDSTIVILFSAFFIEANLNHIRTILDQKGEMGGLQPKLKWFYNEYIEALPPKAKNTSEKLEKEFPGFKKIQKFRNKISHGEIDLSLANRKDAEDLRQKAKDIVNKLYKTIEDKTNIKIHRDITYINAISSSTQS